MCIHTYTEREREREKIARQKAIRKRGILIRTYKYIPSSIHAAERALREQE